MKAPFTTSQFFKVFETYNTSVFPLQVIIILFFLAALWFLHSKKPIRSHLMGGFLAFLWLWTGVVYHVVFFTSINKAAYGFGFLFILQGLFFIVEVLIRNKLIFRIERNWQSYLGYFFIVFGLLIYPVISLLQTGAWSKTISLGLPCPSTILSFGILMLTGRRFSKYLLIIPSLWAVIGTSAAINFGIYQDYAMLAAAVTANLVLLTRKKA
jgi:hypothetical protein